MITKIFRIIPVCGFVLLISNVALTQQPPPDPLAEGLFPPDLIMQNQEAIGLTDDQRNSIKGEVQKAQSRFSELQWQLQKEVEAMVVLVREPRADEQQALVQLDRILAIEREMKRAQIALLIKIKSSLSPEQQARLQQIRRQGRI